MEQSPSLASMARDLGLSVATVSNVYNYPDKVSQKLRERVLAHAEIVKYPGPNPLARQLSIGYTKTIGLIFKEELPHVFRHEAAVGFIDGLAEACSRGGYNLLLIPSNPMIIDRPMASIATAAVDGCIAFSMGDNDADLLAAIGRRQPVVIVDQPAPLDSVGWVGLDDRVAVRNIVRELVSLGHTRFGALTMRIGNVDHGGLLKEEDLDTSRYSVPRERMAGLRQALKEAGLPQLVPTVESFTISRAAGSVALRRLLDADPSISAVVSFDDELALGAIDEARQRGLRVPEDISITGFDDIPSAAVHGLTTVRQPLLQKGLRAGQMLLQRIADQRQTQSLVSARAEVLSTNIVRRTSSGPAPG